MTTEEKYAEKIALLLAKAESTTPEEAELLTAKAQELMTQYAISEALIDQPRGIERDEIETKRFTYGGPYSPSKGTLTYGIIRNNNCKGLYSRSNGSQDYWGPREINGKSYSVWYSIDTIGFKSDLDRVTFLEASLHLQMAQALNAWWKEEDRSWYSHKDKFKSRRSFMDGFTSGVETKLREAVRAGRQAAVKDETERVGDETVASESVSLVLRSRKDRVDDWIDEKYGKLGKGRGRYHSSVGSAHNAGSSAGRSADIGQGRVGSRKGITR